MLVLRGIEAGYGATQVLHGLSLEVEPGEIICLMGRNGAGKSTTLKSIVGLVKPTAGEITFDGGRIDALPGHQIPRLGIGCVPQGRRLFAELTVAENLEIGLMTRARGPQSRDHVLELFPRLAERMDQVSGTLSGGEQQMLAIGRALCLEPTVLLLDEPTEGLQPSIAAQIRTTLHRLRDEGVAIILVEQNIETALEVADRITFIVTGRDVETVAAATLDRGSEAFRRHVGV